MSKAKSIASWVPEKFRLSLFKQEVVENNIVLYSKSRKMIEGRRSTVLRREGIILPDGILRKDNTVCIAEERRECGFSNSVFYLCPLSWKEKAGENWLTILLVIIKDISPTSYLLDFLLPAEEVNNLIPPLRMRLEKSMDVSLKQLWNWFGNIEILTVNEQRIVASLSDSQKEIAAKLGITTMEDILCL